MSEPTPPPEPGAGTELAEVRAAVPSAAHLMTDDEIRRAWRVASALAASGMFKDIRQGEQAMAKIIVGKSLGLGAAQSMTGIHIVEGKPEVSAVTLGSFVQARDGYDYRVREHSDQSCAIEFFRDGDSLGISTFTMEDAETAKLAHKDNWKKYPRNMLYARAMSNGVRWYAPEVTGGIPVYVEGEITRDLIGGGDPDAGPVGLDLGPKVDAVIERAEALGHAGYADRATAEMALGDQPPARVDQWVATANAELDKLEAEQPTDAEVVPDEPEQPKARVTAPDDAADALPEQINALADSAIEAREAGDEKLADQLEAKAETLREQLAPEQAELGEA